MNKKLNKEKVKQIFLVGFAFFLILIGYLNYDKESKSNIEVSARASNETNIGDVQLVNSKPVVLENEVEESSLDENNGKIVPNEEINSVEIKKDDNYNDNYFEETKIERDRMYSEMIETYQNLVESEKTPEDQKAIAVQEISNLTNKKNEIMIAENLIKNKGFKNVVILINNEIVNVIVESENLNQEEISKIQNIVSRELNAEISNINITNKK